MAAADDDEAAEEEEEAEEGEDDSGVGVAGDVGEVDIGGGGWVVLDEIEATVGGTDGDNIICKPRVATPRASWGNAITIRHEVKVADEIEVGAGEGGNVEEAKARHPIGLVGEIVNDVDIVVAGGGVMFVEAEVLGGIEVKDIEDVGAGIVAVIHFVVGVAHKPVTVVWGEGALVGTGDTVVAEVAELGDIVLIGDIMNRHIVIATNEADLLAGVVGVGAVVEEAFGVGEGGFVDGEAGGEGGLGGIGKIGDVDTVVTAMGVIARAENVEKATVFIGPEVVTGAKISVMIRFGEGDRWGGDSGQLGEVKYLKSGLGRDIADDIGMVLVDFDVAPDGGPITAG